MSAPATDLAALTGIATPPVPSQRLTAGRLSAAFVGGGLADISWDGVEIVRAITVPIRDRDWGTLDQSIAGLEVDERDGAFRVAYTATATSGGATLTIEATIEAVADGDGGRLTFAIAATPDADFETNRTGFTVLHPAECAGLPLAVDHADGTREDSAFPDLIEPWQPFMDIAALTHRVDGVTVRCAFDGDVFEMEDQRNWSDASYKTYVRPLALPWPYVLPAGVPVRQAVTLTVAGGTARPVRDAGVVEVAVDVSRAVPLPALALVLTAEEARQALARPGDLAAIAPDRLTVHLDAAAGHGAAELDAFAALAALFDGPVDLEYAARCDDPDAEFGNLARRLDGAGLRPASILVCPSVDRQSTPPGSAWPACPPLADVYAAARRALPGVTLGGGMLSYFTELNRKRPPLDLIDYVAHGTNPIVHAADDRSVMQTLGALPAIMRSARAIASDRPVRLGLSSIPMRQNPYGSRTIPNPGGERVPMADRDPRHLAPFGATFALAYLATIAPFAAAVWTPAAFAGPCGVLGADGPTPLGRLIAALTPLAGRRAHPVAVSAPDEIAALALDGRTLLANLTPERRTVSVDGARMTLEPYATADLSRGDGGRTRRSGRGGPS